MAQALLVPGLNNEAEGVDVYFDNLPDGRGIVARQGVSIKFLGVCIGLTQSYLKVVDSYFEVTIGAGESALLQVSRNFFWSRQNVRAVLSSEPLPKFEWQEHYTQYADTHDLCTVTTLEEME